MKTMTLTHNGSHGRIYAPDRIGLVGFNDDGFIIALPAFAHQSWLQERSQRLHQHVTGVTNMTDGLRKAIGMYQRVPKGVLRRIWLLSDGYPNKETADLMPMVEQARANWININTIGFGNHYDEPLLRNIAQATHNGKFVPVNSLRELTHTLVGYGGNGNHGGTARHNGHHHRSETTVLVIDLSGSMNDPMEGVTKVKVVEEAILHLLNYKQVQFS